MTIDDALDCLVRSSPPGEITPQMVFDIVCAALNSGKGALNDRKLYLDLLVRVADEASDRLDAVHEEIAKEHHRDEG